VRQVLIRRRIMHNGIGYDQEPMYVEAVREEGAPGRAGLARDFMKIECRHCNAAYHLYHDGAGLSVLRDYFLRASSEISGEHPSHSPRIVLEERLSALRKESS